MDAPKVYIYDCNNYVRIKAETSISGSFIRSLLEEANRDSENIVKFYVFDGPNANEYRRNIYPEYKKTRKLPTDNFFENLKWFKELLGYCKPNVCTVQVYGYEADDVIASISKWFKEVTIFSTDKDLLQIPNATLPMANSEWEKRRYIFTRKVLCGDPSDNIKGLKGFGKTTWEALPDYGKGIACDWVENGFPEAKLLFAKHLPTRAKNIILEASDEEIDMLKKLVGFRYVESDKIKLNFGTNELDKIEQQLSEYML